jgi:hypothetical protein
MRGVAVLLACSTILRSRTAHRRTKATRLNKKIIELNEEIQRPNALDVRSWPRRTGRYCSLIPMPARWRQAAGTIISGISLWNGFSINSSRSGAAYSETVGFGLGIQHRRKLRMATGAPVINDLLPSRARATSAPTFLFDHRQREVDHPSRGPHRAVDDENPIFLHPSLLGTEPASHLRGTSAWSRDGHGARPASVSTNAPTHRRGDWPGSLQSLAQKFDQTRVNHPIAELPPKSSVSKFVLSNGSVATPAPIELLMEPPVLDSRRT